MGIDIYYCKNNFSKVKEEYIYTINDTLFNELSDFIKFYKSKTGKVIDLYKDIKLDKNEILQFQKLIKLYLQTYSTNKLVILENIENIVTEALNKNKCIIFYGD